MGTYYAQQAMPDRVHLVTAQDPRDARDWWIEFRHHTLYKKLTFLPAMRFEINSTIRRAVRNANQCYVQAKFAAGKARHLYGLDRDPEFLPNPCEVPDQQFEKAARPLVTFLARLDPRKRPELFCKLAPQFPGVDFVLLGEAQSAKRDAMLRRTYGEIPNLTFKGLVNQFTESLSDYLGPSWIMCNTASRECLPVSFLEAAAHQCSILSFVNPDEFASRGGYHAQAQDFAAGLRWLLEEERWRALGLKGYEYVRETHELSRVIDLHLAVYQHHLDTVAG